MKESPRLTGMAVGICTLEFAMDAGMATGIVCPLGSCRSTGKVPDTGLEEEKATGHGVSQHHKAISIITVPVTAIATMCYTTSTIYIY